MPREDGEESVLREVRKFPEGRCFEPRLRFPVIQDVMPERNDEPQRQHCLPGKEHEQREEQEADADRPDHLQHHHVHKRIKSKTERNDGHFYEYQPQPACKKKTAQLAFGFPGAHQLYRHARKQHKKRRAKMSDPSCEIQSGVRSLRVQRIGGKRRLVKKITYMVERHQYHHQSSQHVNGVHPFAGGGYWLHDIVFTLI